MHQKRKKRLEHIIELIKSGKGISFEELSDALKGENLALKRRHLFEELRFLRDEGLNGITYPIALKGKKYVMEETKGSFDKAALQYETRYTMPFLLSLLQSYEQIPAVKAVADKLKKEFKSTKSDFDKFITYHHHLPDHNHTEEIIKNVFFLTKAMEENTAVAFQYCRVNEFNVDYDGVAVFPVQIKVYNGRFYLLAIPIDKETAIENLRTFTLDAIVNHKVEGYEDEEGNERNFNWKETYEKLKIDEIYESVVVIYRPLDPKSKPTTITRWFRNWAASYIKAVPLHPSQKILEEEKFQVWVQWEIYNTYDLDFELGKFRNDVNIKRFDLRIQIALTEAGKAKKANMDSEKGYFPVLIETGSDRFLGRVNYVDVNKELCYLELNSHPEKYLGKNTEKVNQKKSDRVEEVKFEEIQAITVIKKYDDKEDEVLYKKSKAL